MGDSASAATTTTSCVFPLRAEDCTDSVGRTQTHQYQQTEATMNTKSRELFRWKNNDKEKFLNNNNIKSLRGASAGVFHKTHGDTFHAPAPSSLLAHLSRSVNEEPAAASSCSTSFPSAAANACAAILRLNDDECPSENEIDGEEDVTETEQTETSERIDEDDDFCEFFGNQEQFDMAPRHGYKYQSKPPVSPSRKVSSLKSPSARPGAGNKSFKPAARVVRWKDMMDDENDNNNSSSLFVDCCECECEPTEVDMTETEQTETTERGEEDFLSNGTSTDAAGCMQVNMPMTTASLPVMQESGVGARVNNHYHDDDASPYKSAAEKMKRKETNETTLGNNILQDHSPKSVNETSSVPSSSSSLLPLTKLIQILSEVNQGCGEEERGLLLAAAPPTVEKRRHPEEHQQPTHRAAPTDQPKPAKTQDFIVKKSSGQGHLVLGERHGQSQSLDGTGLRKEPQQLPRSKHRRRQSYPRTIADEWQQKTTAVSPGHKLPLSTADVSANSELEELTIEDLADILKHINVCEATDTLPRWELLQDFIKHGGRRPRGSPAESLLQEEVPKKDSNQHDPRKVHGGDNVEEEEMSLHLSNSSLFGSNSTVDSLCCALVSSVVNNMEVPVASRRESRREQRRLMQAFWKGADLHFHHDDDNGEDDASAVAAGQVHIPPSPKANWGHKGFRHVDHSDDNDSSFEGFFALEGAVDESCHSSVTWCEGSHMQEVEISPSEDEAMQKELEDCCCSSGDEVDGDDNCSIQLADFN